MTQAESIQFAKAVATLDWQGERNRLYLTSEHASITVDLDARIARLTPTRQGRPVVVPLENVASWTDKPAEAKPALKVAR